MKPTPNSHKYPKFLVKESRDNLSQSILKLFKLEEWTQLIKKIDPFQEILVQSNRAVHDLFLNQENLVHPYFDIKVPFLRLLPVVSGGKLKNPKLRNNFSRIHSKFCSGQITYWMGDYEIFRHEIKNDASFKKTNGLLGQPHVSFQTY